MINLRSPTWLPLAAYPAKTAVKPFIKLSLSLIMLEFWILDLMTSQQKTAVIPPFWLGISQWPANMISKIICSAGEVIRSKNLNSSMIRAKVSLSNGFTAAAGYAAKGSQVGLLRLFARRLYCRFGGVNCQWWANLISKIICTAWEVLRSKN